MDTPNTQAPTVASLRSDTSLWYRLHVLVYDLRNFRKIPSSQTRLDTVLDPSYIGPPYFTASEAQTIKSTLVDLSKPIHPGVKSKATTSQDTTEKENSLRPLEEVIEAMLKERLERRNKKREESGDFRVCAAHDLAPILERALGVSGKDFERDGVFLECLEKCGLELNEGDVWIGEKKGGEKRKKGKGKR